MQPHPSATPRKRRFMLVVWKWLLNPMARLLVPVSPWWVLVQTTGWKSGLVRRTPIARGPVDGDDLWLLAAHGRRAFWVRNIEHDPHVRVRLRGRWLEGTAEIRAVDADRLRHFNAYARRAGGPPLAIDPCMVRIALHR